MKKVHPSTPMKPPSDFERKSGKEKLRRFCVAGGAKATSKKESIDMGSLGFDEPEEIHSRAPSRRNCCQRFRPPRNVFDGCVSVNHATVPRKLRSAMKKRNRESVPAPLPDSKLLNPMINNGRILKPNRKHAALPRQSITGPITKDEAEVVETLHALASLFTNRGKTGIKSDGKSMVEKPLTVLDSQETPSTADQVTMDCSNKVCPTIGADEAHGTISQEVSHDSVTAKSFTFISQLELKDSKWCKTEPFDENSSCKSLSSHVLVQPSLEVHGPSQPKPEETPSPERKVEIMSVLAKASRMQLKQRHVINETEKNALLLSLSTATTHLLSPEINVPSQKSPAIKIPPWLDSAVSQAGHGSSESGFLTENVKAVPTDSAVYRKHPWKRCATHAYIARLIQDLRLPDRFKSSQQEFLTGENDESQAGNSHYGVASSSSLCDHTTEEKPTLLHKDQGCAFLSLSAGDGDRTAQNVTESALSMPFDTAARPLLPFLPHHHFSDRFPVAPAPAQQQQQQLPFHGSLFLETPGRSPMVSGSQLQHRIWAARMPRCHGSPLIRFSQPVYRPTPPSFGQPQQVVAFASQYPRHVGLQEHHHSRPFAAGGHGEGWSCFRSDGVLPLQFLCNNQL